MIREKGLMFVGLDVIGDYITEINVTSPTCVREIDDQRRHRYFRNAARRYRTSLGLNRERSIRQMTRGLPSDRQAVGDACKVLSTTF